MGNNRTGEKLTAKQYKATESEASVEARVVAYLEERGYEVFPLGSEVERGYRGRSRRNKPGTPDLMAARPNHAFLLEIKKAKGGRHSPVQRARQADLRLNGFAVFAHESDGTDVIEQLKEFMR